MTETALILVDIQRDYFEGGSFPLPDMQRAAENAAKLLTSFRKKNSPLWHIQHVELDPAGTFFRPASEGAQIHSSVAPRSPEPCITKHFPNSFRETILEKDLRARGIGKLIFCGAMSNMCIDASVRAAFDLGFECTVIHDACAASDMGFDGQVLAAAQVHAAFMGSLASAYAQVLDCAAYLR